MNIFLNKKILIYGLGKSGISAFRFLRNKSEIFLYDDFHFKIKNLSLKKKLINRKNIFKKKFDIIILSPGIDINKCNLSKFLKKNRNKIYSDLDIFYSFYNNPSITITGTNGKSTTCQLLYEVLFDQKYDVRLVGNIGNPILSSKNIKKKTIFVIEASSYQLEYSKIFKSKYVAILNLSPDHIDRHKTMKNYIKAKFSLLKKQSKGNHAFVKKNDSLISRELRLGKFRSKIVKLDTTKLNHIFQYIDNKYFSAETNKENLLFVIEISKYFNLKTSLLVQTIKKFRGLKYRQQIIFKRKYLTIINDSKSTSFSSSIGILKAYENIYWLLGGINKKGDMLNLPQKYFNKIKAFIYGKNKRFFNKILKGKIYSKNYKNLNEALNAILKAIQKEKSIHKTILFSPCAASFDNFKNFEDRGLYFNKLIKEKIDDIR